MARTLKVIRQQILAIDPNLVLNKGLWGYYSTDRRYRKQHGTPCRDSAARVLVDLREGKRPEDISES